MTVQELRDKLDNLIKHGYGSRVVEIWDPDMEDWHPVTGFTYGKDSPVQLYSDED